MNATNKQTWAIFCITGYDVRNCNLTIESAGQLISDLKEGKPFIATNYNGARQVRVNKPKKNYEEIYNEARLEGLKALKDCTPTPMVVQEHTNMLDDNSPVKKSWYVSEGACGFAWVNIRPATSVFCKWLKSKGYAGKSYYGGYNIWVSEGGQSIARKEAYAGAFAEVLQKYNINASMGSRLD